MQTSSKRLFAAAENATWVLFGMVFFVPRGMTNNNLMHRALCVCVCAVVLRVRLWLGLCLCLCLSVRVHKAGSFGTTAASNHSKVLQHVCPSQKSEH